MKSEKQDRQYSEIASYLESNPTLLDKYVLNNVDIEKLKQWIIRRTRRLHHKKASQGCKYFV